MMARRQSRIHALLDADADPADCAPEDRAALARYRRVLGRLERARVRAPDGLATRVMAALRQTRRPTAAEWLTGLLPQRRQWAVPALAGALAALVVVAGIWRLSPLMRAPRVLVHFEVHAPGAERVDLVGDFNQWTPGAIRLRGPDASGHWTADVLLPEGRHEYQFLVDGKNWLTDPNAATRRPDGFGRENAVLDVYEERG